MPLPQQRMAGAARHEQILNVAKELFARLGFEGATTRQIAARAGVNEAILFRHFPSKEDLYWAVIEGSCQSKGSRSRLEEKFAVAEDDREVFRQIAEEILQHSEQDPAMMRLLLFTALENHRLSHRFFQSYIANKYEILAAYIRRRIREGAFRNVDVHLAARSFVGMLIYHALIQELFGGKHYQHFDRRHVSETLTNIWLEGMKARSERPPRSGNQH